jgi:YVTN family beta-propeller protein
VLLKTIPVGGEGFWDYTTVDADARRLYVSHGTHVVVLDADTQAVVGDIPDTQGVHGIAIAAESGHGFVSNGRSNNVTMFDLKTLKTLSTIPTGTNPDAIVYDSSSKRVFAMNGQPLAGTDEPKKETPVYKKWWFWVVVGVSAVVVYEVASTPDTSSNKGRVVPPTGRAAPQPGGLTLLRW